MGIQAGALSGTCTQFLFGDLTTLLTMSDDGVNGYKEVVITKSYRELGYDANTNPAGHLGCFTITRRSGADQDTHTGLMGLLSVMIQFRSDK